MNVWNLFRRTGKKNQPSRKSRPLGRRRPQLEVLEDRVVPSANASGTITGTAFIDHNQTGVLGAGDVGVSGLVITLYGTTSAQHKVVNVTATTTASGQYTFENVLPGTYRLQAGPAKFLLGGNGPLSGEDLIGGVTDAGGQTVHDNFAFRGLAPGSIPTSVLLASSSGNTAQAFPPAGTGIGLANSRPNSAPTVSTAIAPVSVAVNSASTTIDLAGHFTDPDLANSQVTFNTSAGPLNVTLFDATAPQTVANFYDYINSGAYNNAIFSRLSSNFVLQGGGATLHTSAAGSTLTAIPTLAPVPNEFGASNTTDTIAMAQTSGNPNSATDQFFFNLTNNNASGTTNLDAEKFTVFGQLTGSADRTLLNTLAATPVHNESSTTTAAALPSVDLTDVPLNNFTGTNFPTDAKASNFLVINSVTVDSRPEFLTYSVVSDSNPGLVTASLTNEDLTLHYAAGKSGVATITVRATDSLGATVNQSFTVSVVPLTITTVTNPINIANANNASALGTTGVGDKVTVTATDGTTTTAPVTATVNSSGAWTATGINLTGLKDGTITYTAKATNSVGGTITTTATATKDTVAPAVSVTTVTNPINIANQTTTTASGTTEIGATVTVTATDGTTTTAPVTATVNSSGAWTTPAIDVSGLADGTITYTATAKDAAGNTATASLAATKDTVAPAVSVTAVTNPVNIANQTTTTASGTTEVGATVTVTATDGTNTTAPVTATVDGSGNWTTPAIDVSGLADGTITYTATATDSVGNTNTASKTATKDTVAPAITISTVTSPVDITNETNVGATGTTEVGATVSVTVTDGTNTTTPVAAVVDGSGNWTVSGIDASGLIPGPITYVATATDAAGNSATANQVATKI